MIKATMLSVIKAVGILSLTSSKTVSFAPCNLGLVSDAMTLIFNPFWIAVLMGAKAVP
jgi:hypothetical protein